jgi:hypothetical protein
LFTTDGQIAGKDAGEAWQSSDAALPAVSRIETGASGGQSRLVLNTQSDAFVKTKSLDSAAVLPAG